MADRIFWDGQYGSRYRLEAELAMNGRWPLTPDVLAFFEGSAGTPLRILEAGCGPGKWNFYLADRLGREARVVGVDFSGAVRDGDRFKRAHGDRYARVHFVQGDAGSLPVRDGTFDRVLSLGVLGHLPDPLPAVREIARALKPGGLCFADVVNRTPIYRWRRSWDPLGEFERNSTPEEAAAWFRSAGFTVLQAYAKDPVFAWFTALKPPVSLQGRRPWLYRSWWSAAVGAKALAGPLARRRSPRGFYSVVVARKDGVGRGAA